MTTGISLVRENAQVLQPPRSLWVSFPLGRPLGIPGDADFQHRVIQAGLNLLNARQGPLLEDFPEDISDVDFSSPPACPISFPAAGRNWQARLAQELSQLQAWYEIGLQRRQGRTLVGLGKSEIAEILVMLGADLDADRLPQDLIWFKAAIEDVKAYYIEALTAQPGNYDHKAVYSLLWGQTEFGAALRKFYEQFLAHDSLAEFARIVLPREAVQEIPLGTQRQGGGEA